MPSPHTRFPDYLTLDPVRIYKSAPENFRGDLLLLLNAPAAFCVGTVCDLINAAFGQWLVQTKADINLADLLELHIIRAGAAPASRTVFADHARRMHLCLTAQ